MSEQDRTEASPEMKIAMAQARDIIDTILAEVAPNPDNHSE